MSIAAIIIGSNDELVAETRRAVAAQSLSASEILNFDTLEAVGKAALPAHDWLWILEQGMAPKPEALAQMLTAAESSPSAGWLAPKLVTSRSPREIVEYGLTVTKGWRPISPARADFDQAQHDSKQDLLAASLVGSVLSSAAWEIVKNVSPAKRPLTGSFDAAIAVRLGGYRVMGVPEARIAVGEAGVDFTRASDLGLLKTRIDLAVAYSTPLLSIILGLLAPAMALGLMLWFMLIKRPERIGSTLAAGFWWFFGSLALLVRRSKLRPKGGSGLTSLASLRATREDRQRVALAGLDNPAAIAEASAVTSSGPISFGAAGGPWLMLLLAGLSFQFWPKGQAVSGGTLLPLGSSLAHLFSSAGASWQNSGLGVAAPSDPFNWVLLGFGLLTFWAPNLGVTIFIFLVKPLAFASAWRLLSLVSSRAWIITIGALAFAFWPALTTAQASGQLGAMVALVLLPLFVFVLARILQFGSVARRSVQTWAWVGSGGILAAAISSGAPSLTPIVAAAILMLAIYRFRKIGYLIWLPVPLIVVWAPYAWYLVAKVGHPMLVFTDPGGPVAASEISGLSAIFGGLTPTLHSWQSALGFAVGALVLVAVFAVVTKRLASAGWLWLVVLASLASAVAFSGVLNSGYGSAITGSYDSITSGNSVPLLGLAGLVTAVLVVMTIDGARPAIGSVGQWVSMLAIGLLAFSFVVTPSTLVWSNGSTLPALVEAQAQQDSSTRVLALRPVPSGADDFVLGALVTGGGVTLEDQSNAYLSNQRQIQQSDPRYARLNALAANLVAGSTNGVDKGLASFGIDYVQVPTAGVGSGLASALDTIPVLEPVGTTEFGRLWRVKSAGLRHRVARWEWSLTKQVQVAVITGFALLAIPTRRRLKAGTSDEAELDAFEGGFEGDGF